MNHAVLDAATQQVQLNKKIYDWAELEAAVTDQKPLAKQTELSVAVEERTKSSASADARCAQIEERVVAVARTNCIELWYGHTAPGCGLESLMMQRHVKVFPAQGGRTTYEIDMAVNGYFANRHLPMRAKDRGSRSVYRNTKWYFGQSGVYQAGSGPMYMDAGPSCTNLSRDDMREILLAAEFIDEAWRNKAATFIDRVRDATSPFGDAILRYNHFGLEEGEAADALPFYMSTWLCGYEQGVRSRYGLDVVIKHPARMGRSGWDHQRDLALSVCGPQAGYQDADDITYVVGLMHGGGRVTSRDSFPPSVNPERCCVYRKPSSVIDIARRWCGDNIHIPA